MGCLCPKGIVDDDFRGLVNDGNPPPEGTPRRSQSPLPIISGPVEPVQQAPPVAGAVREGRDIWRIPIPGKARVRDRNPSPNSSIFGPAADAGWTTRGGAMDDFADRAGYNDDLEREAASYERRAPKFMYTPPKI